MHDARVQDIVKSLANDVIMPLFGALTGNPSTEGVTTLYFTINNQKILIGNFFAACLTFLMLAALCFYLVILVRPFFFFCFCKRCIYVSATV